MRPRAVAEVRVRLARWADRLAVAAINGPAATVVAGDQDAVEELIAQYEGDGVRVRRIPVDFASHTPHVERIRDQILAALASITPKPATIPFYSTSPASPSTPPNSMPATGIATFARPSASRRPSGRCSTRGTASSSRAAPIRS